MYFIILIYQIFLQWGTVYFDLGITETVDNK